MVTQMTPAPAFRLCHTDIVGISTLSKLRSDSSYDIYVITTILGI